MACRAGKKHIRFKKSYLGVLAALFSVIGEEGGTSKGFGSLWRGWRQLGRVMAALCRASNRWRSVAALFRADGEGGGTLQGFGALWRRWRQLGRMMVERKKKFEERRV